jgi:hypothetical protein
MRVFAKRYPDPELSHVEVVRLQPGNNRCSNVWATPSLYPKRSHHCLEDVVLSLSGNWLLGFTRGNLTDTMRQLDALLCKDWTPQ